MLISRNRNFDTEALVTAARNNLQSRLLSSDRPAGHYTEKEIGEVAKLFRPLVPLNANLRDEQIEDLRALAMLACTELRPAQQITSHRPVIGPLIVLAKKIFWPFLRAQLKDMLSAQQEFNSRLLYALARDLAEKTR